MCICIVSNETLHGLDPYFCSTIGVWESHRGESVMDAPFPQECAGGTRCEFRPTVGGAFIGDAEGGEHHHRRESIKPLDPSCALSIIGQLEYRSTTTR